uniref:Uncharacterized protein n=1 Tax=Romanomermis culicivorax TaxID=13658 RepID=A0A915I579_ROMCU
MGKNGIIEKTLIHLSIVDSDKTALITECCSKNSATATATTTSARGLIGTVDTITALNEDDRELPTKTTQEPESSSSSTKSKFVFPKKNE